MLLRRDPTQPSSGEAILPNQSLHLVRLPVLRASITEGYLRGVVMPQLRRKQSAFPVADAKQIEVLQSERPELNLINAHPSSQLQLKPLPSIATDNVFPRQKVPWARRYVSCGRAVAELAIGKKANEALPARPMWPFYVSGTLTSPSAIL